MLCMDVHDRFNNYWFGRYTEKREADRRKTIKNNVQGKTKSHLKLYRILKLLFLLHITQNIFLQNKNHRIKFCIRKSVHTSNLPPLVFFFSFKENMQ